MRAGNAVAGYSCLPGTGGAVAGRRGVGCRLADVSVRAYACIGWVAVSIPYFAAVSKVPGQEEARCDANPEALPRSKWRSVACLTRCRLRRTKTSAFRQGPSGSFAELRRGPRIW